MFCQTLRDLAAGAWTGDLASGAPGSALFLARYAARFKDRVAAKLALDLASLGVDRAVHHAPCSLFNGLLGALWASAHVEAVLAAPPTSTELRTAASRLATESIGDGELGRHYDLLDGCIGAGVFGLEMGNEAGRRLAGAAVGALTRGAQGAPAGLTWPTEARFMLPQARAMLGDGYFNIGLAHGIPGAIAFLSIAGMSGVESEVCAYLVREACAWLQTCARQDSVSIYPHSVGFDGTEHRPSRLSWCYGDLAVAVAFTWAAEFLDDRRIRTLADRTALAAAERSDGAAGIHDNSLCHGAAGAAYVLRWLHSRLGAPELDAAARFWLRTSRELFRRTSHRSSSAGFLQGLSGAGLVYLDIDHPGRHGWPRLLLL